MANSFSGFEQISCGQQLKHHSLKVHQPVSLLVVPLGPVIFLGSLASWIPFSSLLYMPASNPHSSTFSYAGHFSPLLTCLPQDPPASPFSTGRPEVSLNWLPQQNSHLWCKHGPYPTLRKHGCRFLNHDFFLLYVHFSVTTLSAIASSNGKHYFISQSFQFWCPMEIFKSI